MRIAASSGSCALAAVSLALASFAAQALNNCSTFIDRRARANVTINIVQPFRYSPACVMIAVDASVTFNADFGDHPLFAGVVSDGQATFDPQSPIGAHSNGTTPVVVSFPATGEFPYFCDRHFLQAMMGSIKVVPEFFSDGFE